jgi:hypothetical protein
MIQCFQMKTATVSDTKVSFSAPQSVTHPVERTFNLGASANVPYWLGEAEMARGEAMLPNGPTADLLISPL